MNLDGSERGRPQQTRIISKSLPSRYRVSKNILFSSIFFFLNWILNIYNSWRKFSFFFVNWNFKLHYKNYEFLGRESFSFALFSFKLYLI